jgi:hypothetical protein
MIDASGPVIDRDSLSIPVVDANEVKQANGRRHPTVSIDQSPVCRVSDGGPHSRCPPVESPRVDDGVQGV